MFGLTYIWTSVATAKRESVHTRGSVAKSSLGFRCKVPGWEWEAKTKVCLYSVSISKSLIRNAHTPVHTHTHTHKNTQHRTSSIKQFVWVFDFGSLIRFNYNLRGNLGLEDYGQNLRGIIYLSLS